MRNNINLDDIAHFMGIVRNYQMMTEESDIGNEKMTQALERLLASNNRLPKKLVKVCIKALRKKKKIG